MCLLGLAIKLSDAIRASNIGVYNVKCDYIARFARANLYRPLMGLDAMRLNKNKPTGVGVVNHDGRRSVSILLGRRRYIVSSNGMTVECECIKTENGVITVVDRAVVLA